MTNALLALVLLLGASSTSGLSIDGVHSIKTSSTRVTSICADTEGICTDTVCSHHNITVTLNVDQLNATKIDIPNIYLRDRRCTGFPVIDNKVLVTWSLGNGVCGTDLTVTNTHGTYKNQIFLPPGGIIYRETYVINVTCSYPLDLNVSLPDIIRPDPSITYITVEGNGKFMVKMEIFKNINYTTQHPGPIVDLSTKDNLYVGVRIVDPTGDYSLRMVSCFATPTNNIYDNIKYDIILNSCPNREDGTINVLENGVSPQGKFYFQVFKFVGDHNYVYLHCQVHLCRGSCVSPCGARAAADVDVHGSVSIGPFRLADEKDGAGKPSAFGVFSMLGLLLMNKILL